MNFLHDLADKATAAAHVVSDTAHNAVEKAKEVATEVEHKAEQAVDSAKAAIHDATKAL